MSFESSMPFQFEVPISFFEKADAEPGRRKRIGGIVSTERKDRQGDTILQRGLDFDDFLEFGWYNDNHSKATTDILGYPDKVKLFQKGDVLPDGEVAPTTGHWAEGYLLDTPKATAVWELGKALQKSGRRLGYSVEGSIQKRTGPDRKTIAKAKVKNVAVTNCPVNGDSRLEILAKSLDAVEAQAADELQKTLGMGVANPAVAVSSMGPQTGMGAGRVLAGQSLETGKKLRSEIDGENEDEDEEGVRKSLSVPEAVAWVLQKMPHLSVATAGRVVDTTLALKRGGLL